MVIETIEDVEAGDTFFYSVSTRNDGNFDLLDQRATVFEYGYGLYVISHWFCIRNVINGIVYWTNREQLRFDYAVRIVE